MSNFQEGDEVLYNENRYQIMGGRLIALTLNGPYKMSYPLKDLPDDSIKLIKRHWN